MTVSEITWKPCPKCSSVLTKTYFRKPDLMYLKCSSCSFETTHAMLIEDLKSRWAIPENPVCYICGKSVNKDSLIINGSHYCTDCSCK